MELIYIEIVLSIQDSIYGTPPSQFINLIPCFEFLSDMIKEFSPLIMVSTVICLCMGINLYGVLAPYIHCNSLWYHHDCSLHCDFLNFWVLNSNLKFKFRHNEFLNSMCQNSKNIWSLLKTLTFFIIFIFNICQMDQRYNIVYLIYIFNKKF